jgi:phosphatidylglycerol:prolipoprotein diacylglycerol transferase
MIPYIEVSPIHLAGLITVQPFGLLVVAGCVVGYAVGRCHAGTVGLDQQAFSRLTLWVLVPAFLVAHWVSLLFYYPEALWRDPLSLLRINASLSSYGGLFGATLGVVSYWRFSGRKTRGAMWSYVDAVAVGWTVGWFFGRLGCTLAHDHPGLPSHFCLACSFRMDRDTTWGCMSGCTPSA